MRRKSALALLVVLLVLVVAAVLNGDRLYEWLLALHGARPNH